MATKYFKQIIESESFTRAHPNIFIDNQQLAGSLTVSAIDRYDLLKNMFPKQKNSSCYTYGRPTLITIASDLFKCDYYSANPNEESDPNNNHLVYLVETEFYELNKTKKSRNVEVITTSFTIFVHDKVVAYFDFALMLTISKSETKLLVYLVEIHVNEKYRGSTYWMDLTIAVGLFITEVMSTLQQHIVNPSRFNIIIMPEPDTKSGKKIARAIAKEITDCYQFLANLSQSKKPFSGNVFCDWKI